MFFPNIVCSITADSADATITPVSIVWSRSPISSSSVNVIAAIGALNAAAIPAAIPTDVSRRWFTGPSPAARASMLLTPAHICTVGPSSPSDAPDPICKAHRKNFPTVSRTVTRPFRSANATFTCGIPLPAAAGARYVSPTPTATPPSAGLKIVHQIHAFPAAALARSIISDSHHPIVR